MGVNFFTTEEKQSPAKGLSPQFSTFWRSEKDRRSNPSFVQQIIHPSIHQNPSSISPRSSHPQGSSLIQIPQRWRLSFEIIVSPSARFDFSNFEMVAGDSQFDSLPDDVIIRILARVPVKALLRCKSVCKLWYGLLSSRHFIKLHANLSTTNPMVLMEIVENANDPGSFTCVDSQGSNFELQLDFLGERVKVRSTSNGFLCCASTASRGVYYVCNPVTRELRVLPRTRERNVSRYHPDYEATLVGLAMDASTGRFNVALAGFYRPFGHRPHDQLVCFLYDSVTNAWRRSVSPLCDEFTQMNRNQGAFAGGSIHWLTGSYSYLLVLDLEGGYWRKVGLPETITSSVMRTRIYLLELEGHVSIVQISHSWMCIWELKDQVREDWRLVEKVSLRCILGYAPNLFPISQSKDSILMATQKKILMYGHKDRVWREIYAGKNIYSYPLWFCSHAFRCTLFSF